MTATLPFDRDDLPRATRVIDAPIAAVYETIATPDRWPTWMPDVIEPVIVKSGDRFVFRSQGRGAVEHHDAHVITRGPTHAFAVEIDETERLYFRTRPSPTGTKVDVVAERIAPPKGWRRSSSRRQRDDRARSLESALAQLAAGIEAPTSNGH